MTVNITLRGQSNAVFFGTERLSSAAGQPTALQLVQSIAGAYLGYSPSLTFSAPQLPDTSLVATNGQQAYTAVFGQPLINGSLGSGWIAPRDPSGFDSVAGQTQSEDALSNALGNDPSVPKTGQDTNVVPWLWNEYDGIQGVTLSQYENAVQFDYSKLHANIPAIGAMPYVFVNPIPDWPDYPSSPSGDTSQADIGNQNIKQAEWSLSADPSFGFDGRVTATDGDVNLDHDTSGVYGGPHLSQTDLNVIAVRAASTIIDRLQTGPGAANVFSGSLDAFGPIALSAQYYSSTGLIIPLFLHSGATLPSQTVIGAGFTIHQQAGDLIGVQANTFVNNGTSERFVGFNGTIDADAVLFYEFGRGRLGSSGSNSSPFGAPGKGQAIYDSQGLPLFVQPYGFGLAANTDPNGATPPPGEFNINGTYQAGLGSPPVGAQPGYDPGHYLLTAANSQTVLAASPNMDILTPANSSIAIALTNGVNFIQSMKGGSDYLALGTDDDTIQLVVDPTAYAYDSILNFHAGDVLDISDGNTTVIPVYNRTTNSSGDALLQISFGGGGPNFLQVAFPGMNVSQLIRFGYNYSPDGLTLTISRSS